MPSDGLKNARPRPRVLMVGFAGHQGKEYLPIVRETADVVAGVDPAPAATSLADEWGFPHYDVLGEALAKVDFDAAVVTVPHNEHFPVCSQLLAHGSHVVKEKPFAVTEHEARQLIHQAQRADRGVLTLLQRNFNPVFRFARENLARIGDPYWFSYDYHFNLAHPTTGWRASREQAMGGVLLDMGYHLIDVLSGMFPEPEPLRVHSAFVHQYRETRDRRLEDLVGLMCSYPSTGLVGSLRISRHHHEKTEHLCVLGTEGALNVTPGAATLHSVGGLPLERYVWEGPKTDAVRSMIAHHLGHLDDRSYRQEHFRRQLAAVRTIDGIYRDRSPERNALADRCA
ncbi:Gfo/Idh/MocA family protein [Streptomyces clavuligerus]|uniref:Oxido-reductase n=2 Tax=Streptomyces clavuligerus TaxID=1901 RepID=E2PUT9_STRCL|nr:Gfo/Idh/MocA family oxidoreductase [Streptomyces clavuligerus]ANW17644.1 oxidoreductase [Streptomyces clavuligerus]EFG09836.1 Oxido-reductase [Streptomyces clavuligerus]WDN54499.1 Gfo/Idh/MocA family oxidoreductase [Streptomyces clavuligerus]